MGKQAKQRILPQIPMDKPVDKFHNNFANAPASNLIINQKLIRLLHNNVGQ